MSLFAKHEALLQDALRASRARTWWSAYPESTKPYADSKAAQDAAYADLAGKPFALDQAGGSQVGAEVSPFGGPLGITYPSASPDALVAAAQTAANSWAAAEPRDWVGVSLEILARLNANTQLIAHAVQHTTGQAAGMAFQAGGPHAQERGLEAVAYAWEEMTRQPDGVRWEKPAGRSTLVLDKTWRVVPRGVGLVIGCNTFPTWNGYPGLFASLATGNAVIVKPHPAAILPLAITVRIGREVLAEAGFDPNVLQLAPDTLDAPITKELATHDGVDIVDYTGGNVFGAWLRQNVRGLLYTEEAGANPVVIDSTSSFAGLCQNLAFSLSLYSGQMCTAPQNLFVPAGGIETDEGHKSFDQVAAGIGAAVDALLSDPGRATAVCGAIAGQATLDRVASSRSLGTVVRDSSALPDNPRTATPLILTTDAAHKDAWGEERFGPIAFVVRVADTEEGIRLAAGGARQRGAITAALYSTDDAVIDRAATAFARSGAALSVNLLGGIYVNQSAAWSDFHVSGLNPAGNACLTDGAFVAGRFRIAQMRRAA